MPIQISYPVNTIPTTISIPLDSEDLYFRNDVCVPYVFVIDRSDSISYQALVDARQMVQEFCNKYKQPVHISSVEFCVISYANNVTVDVDFCPGAEVDIPDYSISSGSSLNAALLLALDKIEQKKNECSNYGQVCKANIFAIGTGIATDSELRNAVIEKLHPMINYEDLCFYAIGCGLVDVNQFSYYLENTLATNAVYPSINATRFSGTITLFI